MTLVVHHRVGFNDFINYDDPQYVRDNPIVNIGLTPEGVLWAFKSTFMSNWHPLTWISHMTDVSVFRLNPGGHHLTSLIIHMINVALVFYVLYRMTGMMWQGAFVAALFAIHPLTVESVAWVAERKNVLSTMFWLLTMLAYNSYASPPPSPNPAYHDRWLKTGRYMLVMLLLALSLMSKPMAVTLPFVLLLMDVWPLRRYNYLKIVEKIPLFVLSGISAMITYNIQRSAHGLMSLETLPFTRRVLTALVSYVQYLYMMINPTKLAIFYPYPYNMPPYKVVAAFVIVLTISVFAILTARKRPYLIVGWLWYTGTLVPVIKLVHTGREAVADRYTYVPLIGIYIIMAWGIADLMQKSRFRKQVLATAASVLIVLYCTLTWIYIGHWKNSLSIFRHAIDVVENNYKAYNNYGNDLIVNDYGRLDEAIGYFAKGLQLKSDDAELHMSMGHALTSQGKFEEAMEHYARSGPLMSPDDRALVHKRFGLIYLKRENYQYAVMHLNKYLESYPGDVDVINTIGIALMHLDRVDEAIGVFTSALSFFPQGVALHKNLGDALMRAGRFQEAQRHLTQAQHLSNTGGKGGISQ
ncbi:Tetratricopeptide TPR_2 repeat protein [Candidatus Magnetobacterium bavaricum]|uniref:Tetratricopeptide TPR_2 repeat protein n=1 Tax=Candidatus Magnetobacterium bavaricum TaxID=29290 RepID=A0A0F3GLH0_9BACT|nr:Tetratricopeptide TPR_2 repeat protein [Candidatus Magnetobacterium bavaricum]